MRFCYQSTTSIKIHMLPKHMCLTMSCVKKVLSPGITVVKTHADDRLPFENNFFDVVITRHESFDLSEVNRVLKQGGRFITQQVGGKNDYEIAKRLNDDFILTLSIQ